MDATCLRPILAFLLLYPLAIRAEWTPSRLEVHEWGVSEYDWAKGQSGSPDLPAFVYTDTRPGQGTGKPELRVKDMEADSGIRVRTKPILYFYSPDTLMKKVTGKAAVQVAVEVRFRDGYASAWWPQVSLFRTAEQANAAKPPDLEGWDRARTEKFLNDLKARLSAKDFEEARRHDSPKFDPNFFGSLQKAYGGIPPFPDDERFQLVWDRLEVSRLLPEKVALPGNDLPANHWFKIARQVESDYISNGTEAEKFLFYEGRTGETPAIAIIPQDRFSVARFLVHNISDHPIHDVFLIYRNKFHFWVRYFPQILPVGGHSGEVSAQQSAPNLVSPAIPRWEELDREDMADEREFHRRTELKLSSILRMDAPNMDAVYSGRRNPAQYQPPTQEYRLFPLEIAALERIWNREFFGDEGLTILYRESLDYLDDAAPLHIYTDMEHYVSLSRCSLVVCRHIDLRRIRANEEILSKAVAEIKAGSSEIAAATEEIRKCFANEPFGTLGLLQYSVRSGGRKELLEPLINEFKAKLRAGL